MFGNNQKHLTKLIGYSGLAFSSLTIPAAMANEPSATNHVITLAAVAEPATKTSQNANTLMALANMYRTGDGVKANPLRAFEYCKRAANMGLAEAQFQLAAMYLESDVVNQSEDEAMKWLEKAAAQGHESAKFTYNYLLNNTYYEGC